MLWQSDSVPGFTEGRAGIRFISDRLEAFGQWRSQWRVESEYGLRDFRPVEIRYGYALVFDGGALEHGTVDNETDSTLVSLDFRFSIKGSGLYFPIVSNLT